MSDYYCDICDRIIKFNYKMKHLKTRLRRDLSKSVVIRYCVKNPAFPEIEDILKKHVCDYNERFGFYIFKCEWKLDFDKIIICVKSERKYNIQSFWDLSRNLISKIDYFEKQGYKLSNICEMKITFISDLRNMTCKHYLNQHKSINNRNWMKNYLEFQSL